MQHPDVSIVIAAFDAEGTIADAIASALGQGATVEVLVVDDASRDDTAEVARAVADPRVTVLSLPRNGGPAAARNAGFAAARGTWIAVLDSDDRMETGRLSRMMSLGEREGADVVIDNVRVEAEGQPDRLMFGARFGASGLDLPTFVRGNTPLSTTFTLGYAKPLFRRAFLEAHELAYDLSLRIGEDYLLLADALALGARCAVERTAGYVYRRRADSISARLSADHIVAMRAADDAFETRHRLDPETRRALAGRTEALRTAAAFTDAIDLLKQRRVMAAAVSIARRPKAAWHFRHPIGARLSRLRQRSRVSAA